MNRRRCLTGVHLKGRVVLIDELPEGIDNTNAFFWKPNGTPYTYTTEIKNYTNESEQINIPIDSQGNFDYYYDKYVYNLTAAFANNTNIKELYFDKVCNLNNVTCFDLLFYNCTNLKVLDFTSFNKCKFINVAAMFYNNSNLETIDLTNFDFSSANYEGLGYKNQIFLGCKKLNYLNCGNLFDNGIGNIKYFFRSCGTESENGIIVDNFFNKKVFKTTGCSFQQAFESFNTEIIDFRNADFSMPTDDTNLYLLNAFSPTICKEIHFPDTEFRISNFNTTVGNTSKRGNLEYLNLGKAVFNNASLDYCFMNLPNLNKIRCTQTTKDYILSKSISQLPSKFTTDDSLWEIVELT